MATLRITISGLHLLELEANRKDPTASLVKVITPIDPEGEHVARLVLKRDQIVGGEIPLSGWRGFGPDGEDHLELLVRGFELRVGQDEGGVDLLWSNDEAPSDPQEEGALDWFVDADELGMSREVDGTRIASTLEVAAGRVYGRRFVRDADGGVQVFEARNGRRHAVADDVVFERQLDLSAGPLIAELRAASATHEIELTGDPIEICYCNDDHAFERYLRDPGTPLEHLGRIATLTRDAESALSIPQEVEDHSATDGRWCTQVLRFLGR